FAVGVLLVLFSLQNSANFNIIWRYFSWSNQTLATIGLWAVSAYLAKTGKNFWFTLVPSAFMTVVVTAYFFAANECLGPAITAMTGNPVTTYTIAITLGLVLSILLTALFIPLIGIKQKNTIKDFA
ncbi:MAG: carbon starvation protein A, partial [Spirochaetaceae bacterium]|nr:carbon starvation protein A [Spirochaetaceae bacterium]